MGLLYQAIIPDNLSESRYISGIEALNLPAPEGTSGDWHFWNVFFRRKKEHVEVVTVAGEGEKLNTNHIYGNYGVHGCENVLRERGLEFEGSAPHAANHFRAILDLLYYHIKEKKGKFLCQLSGASEDYLDTEEEKKILLEKAAMMLPHLLPEEQATLTRWLNQEREPGYKNKK